jgi:hypothetical protein
MPLQVLLYPFFLIRDIFPVNRVGVQHLLMLPVESAARLRNYTDERQHHEEKYKDPDGR